MKRLMVRDDFNLHYINSLTQFWQNTRSFRCIGRPKGQDLLLYLEGLSIAYTKKDGTTLVARSGDVVYSPAGGEYRARLFDFRSDVSHTVGINFLLTDEYGERGVLYDDITVFRSVGPRLSPLFHRAAALDQTAESLKKRILVLEILSSLTERDAPCHREKIEPAVLALLEHPEDNPTVSMLAERCGMSEVNFRKLFRAEFGTSPAAYRNRLRLERAARYLEYGQISVQEIADTLGYGTPSHFIKVFRESYGVSPAKYRKAFQES